MMSSYVIIYFRNILFKKCLLQNGTLQRCVFDIVKEADDTIEKIILSERKKKTEIQFQPSQFTLENNVLEVRDVPIGVYDVKIFMSNGSSHSCSFGMRNTYC